MDGKPEKRLRVDEWPRIIQNWLYPPTCLLCGAPGHAGLDLCANCAEDLPYIHRACPRCALPLPPEAPPGLPCGPCQKKPPPFAQTTALFRYEEPARHLIHAYKFRQCHAGARLLGELMAARLAALEDLPEAIVPVPLHPRRYAERGYNPALEIGRHLSRHLRLPVDYTCCRRIRPTEPQSRLDATERRRNLRGAFRVENPPGWRHVAILDDVMTTGTTVAELARTLRRAGVERVDIWCCARAWRNDNR